MAYKIKVKFPKSRFSTRDRKTLKSMATLYASSPYLNKKQKDKRIQDLFSIKTVKHIKKVEEQDKKVLKEWKKI